MKKIIFCLSSFVFCLLSFSCSDQTYAKELEAEKNLIKAFLARNSIEVLPNFPAETVWKTNQYVALEDGMYFHLDTRGTSADSIKIGDVAILRFKMYSLAENADSVLNWTVEHFPAPPTFTYDLSTSYACAAWNMAIACMKYQNAEAHIIVPSKIGFSATNNFAISNWGVFDDNQTVTPRLYHLKLTFKK